MSLKAIELQVALPRTHDAGKVQEQLHQRSQLSHDLAAREMQKETEKQEKTVMKYHQKDNVHLKKDDASPSKEQQHDHDHEENERKKDEGRVKSSHPYKGNSIDFSG